MPDYDAKKEMIEFITKWWVWFCYIGIGVIAHISNMLMSSKKRTFKQIMASVGAALFVGYLTSVYCIVHFPEEGKYIVPIATLSADKIVDFLVNLDWKSIINNLINSGGKKDK